MGQAKNQQRAFIDHYFPGSAGRLLSLSAAKKQASAITTLVVDTLNLTDGSVQLDRALPFGTSGHVPLHDAKKAMVGQTGFLSRALLEPGDESVEHYQPIQIITDSVSGSVWHYGQIYKSYWIGRATSIAHRAELTENERESFLMTCRKLAAHGSKVYAVSYSEHEHLPKSYKSVHSHIVGILVFHPNLYAGTEEAVAAIHNQSLGIVYASQDSEHDVQAFARRSCIDTSNAIPFVWRAGRELPVDHTLYAGLTGAQRENVIRQFPNALVLAHDEPLAQFWKQFSRFLP